MNSPSLVQSRGWQVWQRQAKQVVKGLPAFLLLHHQRALGWGILFVSILIATWVVLGVIYLPPAAPTSETLAPMVPDLSQATIDRLEFWIEDVEDKRRTELHLPPQPVFFVPVVSPPPNP